MKQTVQNRSNKYGIGIKLRSISNFRTNGYNKNQTLKVKSILK